MGIAEHLPPPKLGLPPKFKSWRPSQVGVLDRANESDRRFIGIQAPTGSGKSALAVGFHKLHGGRAAYLTSTKALQDQVLGDFPQAFLMKGRNNYSCTMPGVQGHYSCDVMREDCKMGDDCTYRVRLTESRDRDLIPTNYSYWMKLHKYQSRQENPHAGLGKFDVAILDEAHRLPEMVCDELAFQVFPSDLELLETVAPQYPRWDNWGEWAKHVVHRLANNASYRHRVKGDLNGPNPEAQARYARITEYLGTMARGHGRWVVDPGPKGYQFDPVWPFAHAESALFQGIDKILLMSGTLNKRTMSLLGVSAAQYEWIEAPYSFSSQDFRIYYVPTTLVNFRISDDRLTELCARIAEIMRGRTDRKGLIPCVSYRWQKKIQDCLYSVDPDMASRLICPSSSELAEDLHRFKHEDRPWVLMSPAVSTGYDFPGSSCEFVILPKVPYPPVQSRVMKARVEDDPLYPGYLMMQELVQAAGRGMRSRDDRCEVFLLDKAWASASKRFYRFKPRYFAPLHKQRVPPPLEKLPPRYGETA